MEFQWKQIRSDAGELQKWALIHKESGRTVLVIGLSHHAENKWNWRLRKKIIKLYELYHGKVWLEKFRFF